MTTNAEVDAKIETASRCLSEAAISIITSVCKTTASLKPDQGEINIPGEKIIAVLSLMGDINMTIFLGLPAATATVFAAKFAGFSIPFESPDMADAAGELGNMLAGDVKARLDKCKIKVNISLPTVFRGQDLVLTTPSWETVRRHFLTTAAGDFSTGLSMKKQ